MHTIPIASRINCTWTRLTPSSGSPSTIRKKRLTLRENPSSLAQLHTNHCLMCTRRLRDGRRFQRIGWKRRMVLELTKSLHTFGRPKLRTRLRRWDPHQTATTHTSTGHLNFTRLERAVSTRRTGTTELATVTARVSTIENFNNVLSNQKDKHCCWF